jgi:NTE family protein
MGRRILVLGGGAPNLTLMSGALLAFHDCGLKFDVISMAGAGAVVGLAYLAPKGLTPEQALRNTMNFGVSDAIYSIFPVNFKMFSKGGALAEEFRNYWRDLPPVQFAEHQYGMSPAQKLESDWLLLAGAMMSPSDVSYFSQALCAHVPFIEDIVDFNKLKSAPQCYLNAYCIDTQQIVEFEQPNIDVRHFRAALSFPYLYAPYEIDGRLHYEGAAFSCLNLVRLAVDPKYLDVQFTAVPDANADKFILLDVLGTDLIHPARSLWDAYTQSIIVPLVANAEKELSIFRQWLCTGVADIPPAEWKLISAIQAKKIAPNTVPNAEAYVVEFPVPVEQWPYMLDWSRSNLERLFDIGYESGLIFFQENEGRI